MDLRQLRFLVRTVESASISQAARALNIAQPSLSQRIKDLEAELGVALLDRAPNGVRPTEAGARIAHRARAILRLVDDLVAEAHAAAHEPGGEVLVGLPTTMALHLTTPLVQQVRARYPKVALRISEGMSGHIQEWLIAGRLDLAILYVDAQIDGLRIEKITEEDLCLISGAGAAGMSAEVRFGELRDVPLVLPGPDHGLRRTIERVRLTVEATLHVAVEVDSLPHLKRLAMDGDLHTILPRAACEEEIAQGRLVARRIVAPALRRPIALARAGDRPGSLAMEKIAELMRDLIRQTIGEA